MWGTSKIVLIIFILTDIYYFYCYIFNKNIKWKTWSDSYKLNSLYTPVCFFLEKINFSLLDIVKMLVILTIHKTVVTIQIFIFIILLFILPVFSIDPFLFKKNIYTRLFLEIPAKKVELFVFFIKNPKKIPLSWDILKIIYHNVLFTLSVGYARWTVNNSILILNVFNNMMDNRIFNIYKIINYSIKRIIE